MTFNNQNSNIIHNSYTSGTGLSSSNPYVSYFSNVDPTPNDVNFPIQKRWINFSLVKEWILENFINTSGQTQAKWVLINSGGAMTLSISVPFGSSPVTPDGSGNLAFTSSDNSVTITGGANSINFQTTVSGITSITGDDGVAVTATANNIGLQGLTVANSTFSKAVYTESTATSLEKIAVQVSAAIASSNIAKVGLSTFNNTQFTVDSNGFVSIIGGSTPPTLGLTPDTFTAPGTSPVIPNGSGNIKVTGSLVAAGTNPVRTDSLAANTLEIEVQTAQAIASSTANKVGLAAFNNTQFMVDGNGFVSLLNSGSGTVVQEIRTSTSISASTSQVLSGRGNTPTTSNTSSLISLSMTPKSATNILKFQFSTSLSANVGVGFFVFAGNTLLGSFNVDPLPSTIAQNDLVSFNLYAVAGTTSATTYAIYWVCNSSSSGNAQTLLDGIGFNTAVWNGTELTQFVVTEVLP